jgi:hypothetical protein
MFRRLSILFLFCPAAALAQGHGPVFGYATPTNSQLEYSFDAGLIARTTTGGAELAARGIITYGFTSFLQIAVTTPALLRNTLLPPTRMTGGDDFEAKLGWRFHHQIKGVGTRFESTLFTGLVLPGPQNVAGTPTSVRSAPGGMVAFTTGIASRSHYFWVGAGYTAFASRAGDKNPNVFSYSLVYAYRPRSWRTEPNKWDWRILAEMTGERSGDFQKSGLEVFGSNSHQIFLGPSTLGVYKQFAIEGGVQFAVHHSVGPLLSNERIRVAVNFTYFLFPAHQQ